MTGENYWVGIWQRNCLDGVINGMTMSTGVGWNGIGDDGKARSWGENMGRGGWRQFQKFFRRKNLGGGVLS